MAAMNAKRSRPSDVVKGAPRQKGRAYERRGAADASLACAVPGLVLEFGR